MTLDGRGDERTRRDALGPVADLADVDRDVRVVGRRRDRERVPLEARQLGHVEVEPLAGLVGERRLDEAELDGALRVEEDADEERAATGAGLRSTRVGRFLERERERESEGGSAPPE